MLLLAIDPSLVIEALKEEMGIDGLKSTDSKILGQTVQKSAL